MDIFKVQSISDFESYEYVQYWEAKGGTNYSRGDRSDLQFKMTDRDLFSFPADSNLHVRYQIVGDVSDIAMPAISRVAPINGGFSMFGRSRYLLSDEIAEDILRPGKVCQIKNLIEVSDDYSRGQGKLMAYSKDTQDGRVAGKFTARLAQAPTVDLEISLSAASPHLVNVPAQANRFTGTTITPVDDEAVYLYYNGKLVTIYAYRASTRIQVNLTINIHGGLNKLDYTGITIADEIEFYVEGKKLDIRNSLKNLSGFWIASTVEGIDFTDTDNTAGTALQGEAIEGISNDGFEERRELALGPDGTTSRAVNMFLPVRKLFPLIEYNPILMKGIKQEISVDIANVKEFLMRNSTTLAADIKILGLSWWVPIVKPSLEVKNSFLQLLQNDTPIRLDWVSHNHYYSGDNRTASASNWLVNTTEHRPERVFIFFQRSNVLNNQLENPHVFDHYGLSRIFMTANGDRQFPSKQYSINYGHTTPSSEDYIRVYATYLNACGVQHSDQCTPAVSYEEFKTLYPFYVFDLRAQDEQVWEATTQANLTIEYTLDADEITRLGPYDIHAIVESRRKLELRGVNGRMSRIQ